MVAYLRPLFLDLRKKNNQLAKGNTDMLSSLATRLLAFIFTKLVASMS